MTDTIEERLEDLEQLVVKQAERIAELETQVEGLMRLAAYATRRGRVVPGKAA